MDLKKKRHIHPVLTGNDRGCIFGRTEPLKSRETREQNNIIVSVRRNPVVFLPVYFNAHNTAAFLATGVSPQKRDSY